jgi:hypothetical protein
MERQNPLWMIGRFLLRIVPLKRESVTSVEKKRKFKRNSADPDYKSHPPKPTCTKIAKKPWPPMSTVTSCSPNSLCFDKSFYEKNCKNANTRCPLKFKHIYCRLLLEFNRNGAAVLPLPVSCPICQTVSEPSTLCRWLPPSWSSGEGGRFILRKES